MMGHGLSKRVPSMSGSPARTIPLIRRTRIVAYPKCNVGLEFHRIMRPYIDECGLKVISWSVRPVLLYFMA
jgi:hypothetical protein